MLRYRIEVDCDLSEDEFVAYLSELAMNADTSYQTAAGKDFTFENLFIFPVTGPGYPYPGNGLPLADNPPQHAAVERASVPEATPEAQD